MLAPHPGLRLMAPVGRRRTTANLLDGSLGRYRCSCSRNFIIHALGPRGNLANLRTPQQLPLGIRMASLARRACYKCGNVGHYAEVCSSAERLCYNCKQPGHESNQCPLPRTTEAKQCYHCQGLGHVQADCPTLRLSGTANRCYNCGQPGHMAVSLSW